MNSEKVSVIIPALNAQDTIREAVESVINGSYDNIEILIVDDCSTDDTGKIIAEMTGEDPRIQHHRNDKNCGIAKSRNLMSEIATGRYVAFLDSDDTWEPNKLELCIQMLTENPDIKAIAHALRYLNKNGRKVGYMAAYPTTREDLKTLKENGGSTNIFPSTVVVEREIMLKEGGFLEHLYVGEDTELFDRIAQKYGFLALKIPLGNYRLKSGSLTDKYWLQKRLVMDCIKENKLRISKGEKELTLREYEETVFNSLPPLIKLNKIRRFMALRYARRAAEAWLNREIIKTIIYGIIGTVLSPEESRIKVKRLISQARLSF